MRASDARVAAGALRGPLLPFEIVRTLSQGGMADLFLARVRTVVGMHRTMVVKRLRLKYAHDPEFAAMFIDEARIALALEHANIVRTYEVGTWEGALYIALEHLDGADLAELLAAVQAAGQQVGIDAALTIVRGVAAGLEHAHTRVDGEGRPLDIVHRDVSPGNVFVCTDGQVKLLDFGVGSYADRVSSRTPKGVVKGKFPYMSPEQCLGAEIGPRSDIFSLGVMLYELTTGRRPFRGLRAVDIVQKVIEAPIELPTRIVPGYPPELERVVLRALSKRAEDRHPSAELFGREIEEVARRAGLLLAPGLVARWARGVLGAPAARERPMRLGSESEGEDTVALFPTSVPSRPLHTVLVVDDEETVHRLLRPALAGYHRIAAYSASQALDALAHSQVDLVLLDLNLPDRSGLDVLDEIRHSQGDVPVIVYTGQDDVASAVESMRRGATDFVVKNHEGYARLPRHIQRALTRRRLQRSQGRAAE